MGKGIGELKERTLHAVLKDYLQPDKNKQEIPYRGYIADIMDGNRITEIQTRNFYAMREKLHCFLEENEVTIVYPVTRTKWLLWVDPDTGEMTKKRKSPKTGVPQEIFYELYFLRGLLPHNRLHFLICMVDAEEYRNLNGWSQDRKRGSSRVERIPIAIESWIPLQTPQDFLLLLPEELQEPFTVREYAEKCGISETLAGRGLAVLLKLGVVSRIGKRGRAFLYARAAAMQKSEMGEINSFT